MQSKTPKEREVQTPSAPSDDSPLATRHSPLAIIPAAGQSTRMGRPKLLLPLGGRTVLERVVAAVRQGGAGATVVVIGPHVPELVPLAEAAGAIPLRLAEPTPDMRATVEHGLRWLEEQ